MFKENSPIIIIIIIKNSETFFHLSYFSHKTVTLNMKERVDMKRKKNTKIMLIPAEGSCLLALIWEQLTLMQIFGVLFGQ
jgi:hypothetical protein